jgi:dihydrofolate synthase/folylpolyglutamate synthase
MIDSTLEYLYQLHNRGIKLGLENIKKILIQCGNPHFEFESIHLAGTNGKGSTASIASKILQTAGYKVGLYTSPHLINFNERIRIDGKPITDMEIINFTKKHKIFFEKHSITFFEATTAMAFDHFRKNNVDIAIVETGLGGRLDSTNVLTPIHTIITEIDFDHTHLLGETVEEITAEKCGIIKKETPNTTINMKKNIAAVISEFSRKQNTKTDYINKKDISLLEHNINKLLLEFKDEEYFLPQSGSFQAQNAILAIEVIKKEFPKINHKKIQDGLNRWFWPGRMQQMKNNIFYDVAHNSSGVNILTSDLYEIYRQKPLGLVVMKNDKIRPEIINLFESSFEELIISTIPSKDILSEEDISSISSLKKYQFINSLDDALRKIENKKFDGPKVIFGSHYIAKHIYDYFDFSFDKGHI